MMVSKYEVSGAPRYATPIFPIEGERIRCLMQRLRPQLRIGTHSLVTLGHFYLDIVDHACSIEQFSCEAQGGSDKRAYFEGSYSGSPSRFRG